jgi:hypothetical protein
MQCFVCGEAMRVVMVEPHDVIEVPGFELRTFQCVGCGDVEKRMSFDSTRAHRTVALVPDSVEVLHAPKRPEAADAPVSNSRMKSILGSFVRLRGGKPGN